MLSHHSSTLVSTLRRVSRVGLLSLTLLTLGVSGAVVTFSLSATDNCGTVMTTCTPPSPLARLR